MQVNEATQSLNQYLTFSLAGEEYGISILQVTEIIECNTLTKIPGVPVWIRGVLNLRGSVVPVVDLATKFGLGPTALTRRTCVIIVELHADGERLMMGVMADWVRQVVELGPNEIQSAPTFGPKVRVDCILGMGVNNGRFVVLLDIDRILSSNEVLAASSAVNTEDSAEVEALAV